MKKDLDYFVQRKSFYERTLKIRSGICTHKYKFIFQSILQSLNIGNIFYECGVATGGTAAFFANILDDANQNGYKTQLHLFDTFNGMPQVDLKYDNFHKKGNIPSNLENTKKHIEKFLVNPDFIQYHKGLIPETFIDLESHEIAFAHIDVDIYSSYKSCCEFIFPRLIKGGIMIFDDYGHEECAGAKIAVDEYFNKIKHPVEKMTSQQYYVIKN